jgi:outer membrane protein OmpU
MKKILLATAALSAMTGYAAAEVTVTGTARMGLVYDSISGDTLFSSRVRVKFEMMGTTDGGLEFGAAVRADQVGGNGSTDTDNDPTTPKVSNGVLNGDSTVYIKGAFGKLTMGDVGGAPDALVGQVSGVGFGPNDALQEIDFLGTDKTAVYYEYSSGALTFGAGAGQTNGANENYNVAVKYSTDAFSVAIGYEDSATDKQLSASGSATFGAATVKAKIVDQDSNNDIQFALSADYVAGAGTYTAFYTDFGDSDTQHVGIGAAYDLGGGAAVKAGVVRQMNNPGDDETFADVGITMSF